MSDRLFLAVPFTEAAAAELARQLRHSFPGGLPGREVPPRNWHLTLRFLGDTVPDVAARVRGELAGGGLGRPFHVAMGVLGAFPQPARARVLWSAVTDGAGALVRLAEAVSARLAKVGIAGDNRPYSPHLTLSRLRDPADLRPLLAAAAPPDVDLPVTEVVLYRSELGAGPPRYEVVERFPL